MGLMYNTETQKWRFKNTNAYQDSIGTQELTTAEVSEQIYTDFKAFHPTELELHTCLDSIEAHAGKDPARTYTPSSQ